MVSQVWSCWTSCSQAGNQLQIHDDFTAHLVLASLIQIEWNLRWMSPHWKKNQKRSKPQFIAAQNLVDISIPPPKNWQPRIENWPFYLGGDRSSLPSVPPNLFAAGANHLGLPVPRTFLSSGVIFGPKNRIWVLARHFFFQTLSSQTLVNRFFFFK